jgi:hypothetical protein
MSTPQGAKLGPSRHPSRIRWIVGAGIAIAVVVAVVLLVVYSGGGSGSGY